MITEKELTAVELSPTKRDFYQIWNELLETSQKLNTIWNPVATNESDPGIVLLKVLTAIADKLNYQIDKNTLECFMPSATQEESMRKLCEMMGYSMKYYQSATTDIQISYKYLNVDGLHNSDNSYLQKDGASVLIPKYSSIKDADNSVNYITLNDCILDFNNPVDSVSAIEGDLVECETDDDNIISMLQLDDNFRYVLPETQIAENGIFITNISDGNESDLWAEVDNLNTQPNGKPCWKFGYDSRQGLPYIQFPSDISTLIEDGLHIKYQNYGRKW